MNDCIFCRMVAGAEPKHHIWENDQFMTILTWHPHQPGHMLIIPKRHVDYFFDMSKDEYLDLMALAYKFQPTLKRITKPIRIGLAVEGFGVGHAHLHMIPLHGPAGLDSKLAHFVSEEELASMAKTIREALEEDHVI